MTQIPKLLIITGVVIIIAGLVWQVGGKYFSLGKLPGDIIIRRENSTFYFPLMTSIIISVVLSLILYLFGRFR
ncbi:DUF2905 domain-containing protein [Salipaludibacillus aurantiacus]|uniref:DUF2905 domain-containing protein n=1 Tax=Salipaludibacillus aurantiacus TaxID=1601833 RepID=A0A1H9RKP3_9BACI|nr:DUF2905 domain-containing protein [Salipaludibacillus aurantiacus]SER73234.1 Protein of unknown function [Salipaludibacillus aurantiacus]